MTTRRIRARRLVAADGVRDDATLVISDGRIAAIEPGSAGDERHDGWLVPGFVDTHCHGGGGADFTDPDPAAVTAAIDVHRRHGSTTLFASTVTNEVDVVAAQVEALAARVEAGELAGIHLEGPCLAVARKGAHSEALLRDPAPQVLEPLLAAGRGTVRMVTLAPEREHGVEAVRGLADRGVVAAFGHSDADARMTEEAVAAGAVVATHLFNAMRSIHHREPGPVPVLLQDPRVTCELICDGVHLDPRVARLAIRAAGPDRIALVTDAMSATGCDDGRYELGALQVQVVDHVARIVEPDGTLGAIAGSTLTMDRAFTFVVQEVGCAIPDAARMAATTPARVHGLGDVGSLEPGKAANACLVDDAGELQRVMLAGRWLDEQS